jgi:hypothetical protein
LVVEMGFEDNTVPWCLVVETVVEEKKFLCYLAVGMVVEDHNIP